MPSLTPEQIEIVKSTWVTVANAPEDSGEAILLRFFEKYPHNQKYFPFRNVPLENLKGSAMFRSHAGRVIAGEYARKCFYSSSFLKWKILILLVI